MKVETQVDPKRTGDTEGPGDQGRAMGTGGQVLEMKPECRRTEAGPVRLRTELKMEGRSLLSHKNDGPR